MGVRAGLDVHDFIALIQKHKRRNQFHVKMGHNVGGADIDGVELQLCRELVCQRLDRGLDLSTRTAKPSCLSRRRMLRFIPKS